MKACSHSIKHKIDYGGSQMTEYRSNLLGLLVEGVKREEDEQKGWGSGKSLHGKPAGVD